MAGMSIQYDTMGDYVALVLIIQREGKNPVEPIENEVKLRDMLKKYFTEIPFTPAEAINEQYFPIPVEFPEGVGDLNILRDGWILRINPLQQENTNVDGRLIIYHWYSTTEGEWQNKKKSFDGVASIRDGIDERLENIYNSFSEAAILNLNVLHHSTACRRYQRSEKDCCKYCLEDKLNS